MRLIDADELIKAIAPIISECKDSEIMGKVIKSIEGQPTAFDKNKVITTLKDQYEYSRRVRNKINIYFEYWDGRVDSYGDAISVVEKGGIDG